MTELFYYNAVIQGSGISTSTNSFYEDIRTVPLLHNPNDYMMSVIRFSIDASHIPIFVCQVIQNPSNVNDINFTPYTFTMQYNNIKYTQNIIFVPNSRSHTPLPIPPGLTGQDKSSSYYYVYYYSSFINMMNTAIDGAYAQMTTANPGIFPSGAAIPYFYFDPHNEKINFVVPIITVGGNANAYITQYDTNGLPIYSPQPANSVIMYANSALFRFIDGLSGFSVPNGNNFPFFLLNVDDMGYNYITATNSYRFSQEYNTVGSWDSLSSIVFITGSIPIQAEYIPSIDGSSNYVTGSSNRYILTDFVPIIEKKGEQRGRFIYNPTAQYRYIPLKSGVCLNRIDIQMYWQDKNQNLYPLTISYGEVNTVKILFIKKSLIEGTSKK